MDFLSQTYIALRGPTGAPQSAQDTIAKLSDRLSPSTLLADRRAAVLALKGLVRDCQEEVGDRALPGLLQVLQNDAEINTDIAKAVLEAITQLCEPDDVSRDLALKHTDYVLGNEQGIHILFALLSDSQFYTRYATLQLLSMLLQNRRSQVQSYFLKTPAGASSIIAVLEDKREIIRNDVLHFFPSFYEDPPSTPGIVALARLAYRVDPTLFVRALAVSRWQEPNIYERPWITDSEKSLPRGADDVPLKISCPVLPPELCQEIALHLHVRDLLTLGLVSRLCREAASTVLRYPHVCAFRLVAAKEKPQGPTGIIPYRDLVRDRFFAVRAGIPANICIAPWGAKTIVIPLGVPHSNTLRIYFSEIEFGDGD